MNVKGRFRNMDYYLQVLAPIVRHYGLSHNTVLIGELARFNVSTKGKAKQIVQELENLGFEVDVTSTFDGGYKIIVKPPSA